MDKKTLFLLLALGLGVIFFYLFTKSVDIKPLFNFSDYFESSPSSRTTFSDLLETPTPSPSPEPSLTPEPLTPYP